MRFLTLSIKPHVAERLFDEMAREAKVLVLRKTRLASVAMTGKRIVSLHTDNGLASNRIPKALGKFRFEAGANARITVANAGADGYVVVDGLQILPVGNMKRGENQTPLPK